VDIGDDQHSTSTSDTIVAFDGVAARFVRLTINSNWGSASQYGLSEVRFTYIPTYAREPLPADGQIDVSLDSVLSWRAGREAVSHEVYLGVSLDRMPLVGTTAQSCYSPAMLDLKTTYYWQVNEINPAEAIPSWQGDLWSFSTEEFVEVDGFETYTDDKDAGETIWQTWVDGYGVSTNGSQVGYSSSPFAEQTIVRSGRQSMPLFYDNAGIASSEAQRIFTPVQDWTARGVENLSLSFYGEVGNRGQLYVKINGNKVLYDGDAADIAGLQWVVWSVDLSTVGGDLSSVSTLTIGIEGAGSGVL